LGTLGCGGVFCRERDPQAKGTVLVLVGSFVMLGYAVLVGSRRFAFHVLGAGAIALVVALSLVVLLDLSFPFSGDLAISPSPFRTGVLSQFFAPAR
jgi:hypothetical protein